MSEIATFEKCGTVTVSVYKNEEGLTCFLVNGDNDEVTNLIEIIEDTLAMY